MVQNSAMEISGLTLRAGERAISDVVAGRTGTGASWTGGRGSRGRKRSRMPSPMEMLKIGAETAGAVFDRAAC